MKVLLVSDHDINIASDLPIHLLSFFYTADAFPQGGAIVEVVGNDRARFLGRFGGFDNEFCCAVSLRAAINAAGVQPSRRLR